jgi:hypothetical protein
MLITISQTNALRELYLYEPLTSVSRNNESRRNIVTNTTYNSAIADSTKLSYEIDCRRIVLGVTVPLMRM